MHITIHPNRCLFFLAVWAASMLCFTGAQAQDGQNKQPCQEQQFEDSRFVVCSVDPTKADLRLFWRNKDGDPYRAFTNLADALAAQNNRLVFAMNAGMYDTDFSPLGLYVEDGRELKPINTEKRAGTPGQVPNFFKNPNGVFFLGEAGPGILPTEEFLKRGPQVRLATQSGPLIVIDNKLNPILIPTSTDKTRRAGVGIASDNTLRFVISEDDVNFHQFARLFRDQLKCPNAMFLDGGNGTGLYNPALSRNDRSWHGGYGPIFALVE